MRDNPYGPHDCDCREECMYLENGARAYEVLRVKLEDARADARAYKDAWMQARQAQMEAELRAAEVREENERMRAVVDAAEEYDCTWHKEDISTAEKLRLSGQKLRKLHVLLERWRKTRQYEPETALRANICGGCGKKFAKWHPKAPDYCDECWAGVEKMIDKYRAESPAKEES